jgi:hypothetical protein
MGFFAHVAAQFQSSNKQNELRFSSATEHGSSARYEM